MKRTKDLKTNKGITLIALVITIIVMLILVAVTISMAINGGLFDYAGKATGETKNAIANEQELANLEANMTVDELINKYTSSKEKTITFKICNETFTVAEGTTWGTWASSTEGVWTVVADGKIAQGTTKFIGYEGVAVASDSPIVSGREYVTIITFTIGEESYTAAEGMTWLDWLESSVYESGDWTQSGVEVRDKFSNAVCFEDSNVSVNSTIMEGGFYTVASSEDPGDPG